MKQNPTIVFMRVKLNTDTKLESQRALCCTPRSPTHLFISCMKSSTCCGPTNRQPWSRKSSRALWFSFNPIKRFHLSVLRRETVKACSLKKSTLSSEMALIFTWSIFEHLHRPQPYWDYPQSVIEWLIYEFDLF